MLFTSKSVKIVPQYVHFYWFFLQIAYVYLSSYIFNVVFDLSFPNTKPLFSFTKCHFKRNIQSNSKFLQTFWLLSFSNIIFLHLYMYMYLLCISISIYIYIYTYIYINIYIIYKYPHTRVSSFPGLISVARVKE